MVKNLHNPQSTPTPLTAPVSPANRMEIDADTNADDIENAGTYEDIPVKLKGDEVVRNQRLYAWIKQELDNLPDDYVFSYDESSKHGASRHYRSEQDYSWYVKPDKSGCLSVGVEGSEEGSQEYMEKCKLAAISGDSKMNASEKHIYQLYANMNKTSADLAFDALKGGILFSTITIYGLLLGYKQLKYMN